MAAADQFRAIFKRQVYLTRFQCGLLIAVLIGNLIVDVAFATIYYLQYLQQVSHPSVKVSQETLVEFPQLRTLACMTQGENQIAIDSKMSVGLVWEQDNMDQSGQGVLYQRNVSADDGVWTTYSCPNHGGDRPAWVLDISLPATFFRRNATPWALSKTNCTLNFHSNPSPYDTSDKEIWKSCPCDADMSGHGCSKGIYQPTKTSDLMLQMTREYWPYLVLCGYDNYAGMRCNPLKEAFILPYVESSGSPLEGVDSSTLSECVKPTFSGGHDPLQYDKFYGPCLQQMFPTGIYWRGGFDMEIIATKIVDQVSNAKDTIELQSRAQVMSSTQASIRINFNQEVRTSYVGYTLANAFSSWLAIAQGAFTIFSFFFVRHLSVPMHFAFGAHSKKFQWEVAADSTDVEILGRSWDPRSSRFISTSDEFNTAVTADLHLRA